MQLTELDQRPGMFRFDLTESAPPSVARALRDSATTRDAYIVVTPADAPPSAQNIDTATYVGILTTADGVRTFSGPGLAAVLGDDTGIGMRFPQQWAGAHKYLTLADWVAETVKGTGLVAGDVGTPPGNPLIKVHDAVHRVLPKRAVLDIICAEVDMAWKMEARTLHVGFRDDLFPVASQMLTDQSDGSRNPGVGIRAIPASATSASVTAKTVSTVSTGFGGVTTPTDTAAGSIVQLNSDPTIPAVDPVTLDGDLLPVRRIVDYADKGADELQPLIDHAQTIGATPVETFGVTTRPGGRIRAVMRAGSRVGVWFPDSGVSDKSGVIPLTWEGEPVLTPSVSGALLAFGDGLLLTPPTQGSLELAPPPGQFGGVGEVVLIPELQAESEIPEVPFILPQVVPFNGSYAAPVWRIVQQMVTAIRPGHGVYIVRPGASVVWENITQYVQFGSGAASVQVTKDEHWSLLAGYDRFGYKSLVERIGMESAPATPTIDRFGPAKVYGAMLIEFTTSNVNNAEYQIEWQIDNGGWTTGAWVPVGNLVPVAAPVVTGLVDQTVDVRVNVRDTFGSTTTGDTLSYTLAASPIVVTPDRLGHHRQGVWGYRADRQDMMHQGYYANEYARYVGAAFYGDQITDACTADTTLGGTRTVTSMTVDLKRENGGNNLSEAVMLGAHNLPDYPGDNSDDPLPPITGVYASVSLAWDTAGTASLPASMIAGFVAGTSKGLAVDADKAYMYFYPASDYATQATITINHLG